MVHLHAVPDDGVLDLGVVVDLAAIADGRAAAHVGERPHGRPAPHGRVLDDGVLHAAVWPDGRVPQRRPRPDDRARRHGGVAVEVAVGLDDGVGLQAHAPVDVDGPGVAEGDARVQVAGDDALAHEALGQRQRLAVDEAQARLLARRDGGRGAAVGARPRGQPLGEAVAARVLLQQPGGLRAEGHVVAALGAEVGEARARLHAPLHDGVHAGGVEQGRIAPDEQGRLAVAQRLEEFARPREEGVGSGEGVAPPPLLVAHGHDGGGVEPAGGVDDVLGGGGARHLVERGGHVGDERLAALAREHDDGQRRAHRARVSALRGAGMGRPARGTGSRSWGSGSSLIGVFGGVRRPC